MNLAIISPVLFAIMVTSLYVYTIVRLRKNGKKKDVIEVSESEMFFYIGQFEFPKVYNVLNRHSVVYNAIPIMNKDNELVCIKITLQAIPFANSFAAMTEIASFNLATFKRTI